MIISGILLFFVISQRVRGLKGKYIHGTKNYYADAGEDTICKLSFGCFLFPDSGKYCC